jgi:hypothetical protein
VKATNHATSVSVDLQVVQAPKQVLRCFQRGDDSAHGLTSALAHQFDRVAQLLERDADVMKRPGRVQRTRILDRRLEERGAVSQPGFQGPHPALART